MKDDKTNKLLNNKQLAEWLGRGYGQAMFVDTGLKLTCWSYHCGDESPLMENVKVRRWCDYDWVEPTYEYCFYGIDKEIKR